VTNVIPPEGDEYNARRQEELHAAIANKAQLTRRMSELIHADAPIDQIGAVIDAIASIDREIPHISKDLAVSVQGRNLTIFMDRMDVSLKRTEDALKAKADADTAVLAAVNSNLTLISLSVEQVLEKFTKFEKELGALKKGQSTLAQEVAEVKKQQQEILENQDLGEKERAALSQKFDDYIASEHTALAKEVKDLKTRLESLEARGTHGT
jgi:chromosome segregation ATPase